MGANERQKLDKLRQIRGIMEETPSHKKRKWFQNKRSASEGQRKSAHKVGVFCSEEMNTEWLQEVLRCNLFQDEVRKFKCIKFKDKKNIKEEASKYTFCICLCNRRNWTHIVSPPWREAVEILLEQRPLMVMILDVKDSSEEGKRPILQNLNSIGIESRHLFLFSRLEEDAYTQSLNLKINTDPVPRGHAADTTKQKTSQRFFSFRKLTRSKKKDYRPPHSNPDPTYQGRSVYSSIYNQEHKQENPYNKEIPPRSSITDPPQKYTVGIFSRSSSDDYSWLVEALTSEDFRDHIQEVRPCYISNNGFQQFMEDLSQCTFGILYHTKNRGRINITNVTDSLYDDELDCLNKILGKDVIVLIDDLEDSRDPEKKRILDNQPDIDKLASNLLLFSHTEKANKMQLVRKLKSIKQFCHPSGYQPPLSNVYTSNQDRPMHPSINYSENTQERPYNKENVSKGNQQGQRLTKETSDPPPRHDIVVFSILEDFNIDWLQKLLSSKIFRHRQVTLKKISFYKNGRLRERALQCNFGIIYHSMRSGWPVIEEGFLYNGVLQQSDSNNMIVIIDDLKDNNEKEAMRNFCNQLHIQRSASELILVLCTENEEQIIKKLNTIKQLSNSPEHSQQENSKPPRPQTKKKTPTSRKSIIGVFSVSEEGHIDWLRRLLTSDTFGQREVTYHKMPSCDDVGLEEGKFQCVVAILYHTMKSGKVVSSQGEFLYNKATDQLVQKLGKDNVIVLIDDIQRYTDTKWAVSIKSSIERWAGDLLYITPEEKFNRTVLVQRLKSLKLFCKPPEYGSRAATVLQTSGKFNTISSPVRSVIGVFSHSEQSKFDWLVKLLSSKEFGNHEVKFHQIFPKSVRGFKPTVSQCKFGILYHCMDRGYKPLTDHKNSLYDEELKYLSTILGKSRVIVVMDELGNSDEEAKSWTLENQPSLGMLARDVLLFTKSEKTLHQKPNRSMHVDRRLSTVYEKLNTLKEILKEGMTSASFSNSREDLV